jgi:predicted RNA binding protein YcfA (HicA-like mRNA interferase family)
MPKLPVVKPKNLLKSFKKVGFTVVRQTGSHARLHHQDGRRVTIALHNRPLKKGTLHSILKQADLKVADLL